MAKDPTDSSMPTSKMILLDQLKRYNNNIRWWIDSRFLPIENMRNIIDELFGVGYVWISYTDRSPASLIGGIWTPITGRFPYFNAGNSTGGANSQTLSIAQMPSHAHPYTNYHMVVQQYEGIASKECVSYDTDNWGDGKSTKAVGGGQPYNNMPAYQTLYAWRRVQ